MSMRMEYKGSEELLGDFEKLATSMSNYGETALKDLAGKFKKRAKEKVRAKVKTDRKLTSGFSTKIKYGRQPLDIWANFSGESPNRSVNPHWHLIEYGHDIVRPYKGRNGRKTKDGGAHIGHVEGIHVLTEMEAEFGQLAEDAMLKALDKALEDGNLK